MLIQKIKIAKFWNVVPIIRAARKSTIPEAFSRYGQSSTLEEHLPADIFKLLMETKTYYTHNTYKKDKLIEITVYDRIQSYKSNYLEKAVLLNGETANKIAQAVFIHSKGDKSTTFFDGEGGLCQIAAAVSEFGLFKEVCVLEKDKCLESLHNYAKNNYLDPNVPIYEINLTKIAVDSISEKHGFVSPFSKLLPLGNVDEEIPSSTIITTASHGFVKYLTTRMLYRDNPFGEFYSSRPEFFLIVAPRTYFHLCCGINEVEPVKKRITEEEMRIINKKNPKTSKLTHVKNVLFQIFFDFCLVDILPRKSYYPWKPFRRHNKTPMISNVIGVSKIYEEQHENLMLVYVRPKKSNELEVGNPVYFDHYLNRMLKTKDRMVVEVFEEWSTAWGFVVVEAGFTIFTKVSDLGLEDLLILYKVLINIPNFEYSNFVAEANAAFIENHENEEVDDFEMEKYRINLARKMRGIGGEAT